MTGDTLILSGGATACYGSVLSRLRMGHETMERSRAQPGLGTVPCFRSKTSAIQNIRPCRPGRLGQAGSFLQPIQRVIDEFVDVVGFQLILHMTEYHINQMYAVAGNAEFQMVGWGYVGRAKN